MRSHTRQRLTRREKHGCLPGERARSVAGKKPKPRVAKKSKPDPWTHAREVAATVEARVEFIETVMRAFLWERGKSGRRLSEFWGVPVSTIQNYSAEASRRCTASAEDVRRDITLGGRELLKQAIENRDHAGFRQVGEILASVSGAKAPDQHVLVTTKASPSEASRLVREAFGERAAKGEEPAGSDGPGAVSNPP